jgi:microsomal dipeptidase-like Zn-dependent dipeptidase
MVKVAGVDDVGVGSDFDGIDCSPQGLDFTADLPNITQALYERGYSTSAQTRARPRAYRRESDLIAICY